MIPILFEPKTTDFSTNGIGRLSDAVSCSVTEERNGIFELEMTYPLAGELFKNIGMASVILAIPGDVREAQPFSVYRISKPFQGLITINAQHISYQLSHVPCAPFTASNATAALQGLKQHAAEPCPYTFWTDKASSGNFKVSVPTSIRSRLGGVTGSILDVYGGEYEFDRFTVKLHANRGRDQGITLRYGKNITDLKQEENISNTITGVYPYWTDSDGNLVQLPEKVISSNKASNFPYPRTIPLDMSSEFEAAPTVTELRTKAREYIEKNNIGVPAVSVSVSFVALWQTEEYKNIAPLERVQLCDTVTVEYEKLGVSVKAKVVKTVYDVLQDRYSSIDIGEVRANLASTIAAQQMELGEKPTKGFLDAAVKNATNWITGVNGGYVVFHKDANGVPYEILIMDTDNIDTARNVWRWNQNGWGHSKNGYNGPYELAATIDGGIVANFITTGTMLANRIKGGTLELGGPGNGNGLCIVRNAAGKEVIRLDLNGIAVKDGEILADIIKGGILKLGGANNVNGACIVYSAAGKEIVRLDVNGIAVLEGEILADIIKGGILSLGGLGNKDGQCQVYDAQGHIIGSISNQGFVMRKGKIDITTESADESFIDLRWSYTYPSGTQHYRSVISPREVMVLVQDPDGTKRYSALGAGGVTYGTFEGSLEGPSRFHVKVNAGSGGLSDADAYSGTFTADGKSIFVSGGIIRRVS